MDKIDYEMRLDVIKEKLLPLLEFANEKLDDEALVELSMWINKELRELK